MKRGSRRKRPTHHAYTAPAVICLPPPSTPVSTRSALRKGLSTAVPLPFTPERLVKAPPLQRNSSDNTDSAVPSSGELTHASLPPLPRNHSLAQTRPSITTMIGQWLRMFITKRKKRPSPPLDSALAIDQILSLRNEVAGLQQTLDHLLKRGTA